MVYVSKDGNMQDTQSWSLWSIPEYFWGIINFIVLLLVCHMICFQTLVQPNATKMGSNYQSDYRRPGGGGGGGGGGPRRRMGGFRSGQEGPASPPMGGG